MSKHYPVEQRERAVKMVLDHLDEYGIRPEQLALKGTDGIRAVVNLVEELGSESYVYTHLFHPVTGQRIT